MKSLICVVGILAATLCPALPVAAQSAGKAPMARALENAMTPGEGQKRLNPLIAGPSAS